MLASYFRPSSLASFVSDTVLGVTSFGRFCPWLHDDRACHTSSAELLVDVTRQSEAAFPDRV